MKTKVWYEIKTDKGVTIATTDLQTAIERAQELLKAVCPKTEINITIVRVQRDELLKL